MNEQDRAIINQGNWFNSRSKQFQQSLLQHAKVMQQLADMTYLTRQTINQILQLLSAKNIVSLHYQRIEIIDKEKLHALAQ
ncbi:MAG: helix-turn-helix domain-containing protein [Pseudoalteromonas prydzensis]|uniref:helix-turn-helix domain-containing protein n=1 Tax=Pseudoalteromonas prydzensis TaxID=182141 RepID=UPI0024BD4558|nr:helix-turn-helix domain-containing protein [Pseudoalteromonas prydzensis]